MGYPLDLEHICAIWLYCGKSCNVEFSKDQINFKHSKWIWLDWCLHNAVRTLCFHERREEAEMELYCGLKDVRLDNAKKEIKGGNFISHVSTSADIHVARIYRSDQGCILHFHPSMRRAINIYSCDVSWISPFGSEYEILFARSFVFGSEADHIQRKAWNAEIEEENEHTQTILLTSAEYNHFIERSIHVSAILDYTVDLNVIYVILNYGRIDDNGTTNVLFEFQEWKHQKDNLIKYEEKRKQFMESRCCNHHLNLFCIFLSETNLFGMKKTDIQLAIMFTVTFGLPFVEKDKKTWLKKR
ncbi:hypothetical protein RFI_30493 [Reticulomyxa filosa]|uniref:Uncharacterized protein n=1 Tax=Reticulomyxa filosa TaxID=46433 RepID=X6LZ79_RETFI|nr:hypothetical protein RFI_30493 [Reticulomyxa filosa]|eukprot:ETO06899.1 hypothetical protein RFI_30493 [Reticulomyxa filosa]